MNCVSGLFRGDMGAKSIALSSVTESIKRMTQQICNARSRLYKSAVFVRLILQLSIVSKIL